MKQKLMSILLIIVLILSMQLCVFAEPAELITNGDFEKQTNQRIDAWNINGGNWGEEFFVAGKAASGASALGIRTDTNAYAVQLISGLIPGEEYTLKAKVKVVSRVGTGAAIKSQFFDGTQFVEGGRIQMYGSLPLGRWEEIEHKFTLPQNANAVEILLRVLEGGEVHWDAVSIMGEKAKGAYTFTGVVKEDQEFFQNSFFETVKNNKAELWTVSGGTWGKEFSVSKDAYEGESALEIKTDGNAHALQLLKGIIPGETYTVTAQVKVKSRIGVGAAIKAQFFSGSTLVENGQIQMFGSLPIDKWTEIAHNFTVPEGADNVEILLRVLEGGNVLWDNVSMVGKRQEVVREEVELMGTSESDEILPPVEGEENMLTVGTFEDVSLNGSLEGVSAYKDDWSGFVSVVEDAERKGHVVRQYDEESSHNPWIRFTVSPVLPGSQYQVRAWLRAETLGASSFPGIKIEYYDKNGKNMGEDTKQLRSVSSSWEEVFARFVIPEEEIASVQIYLRLYGSGEIYWDDAQFYLTKRAPYFTADTGFFYYRDEKNAEVSVQMNTVTYQMEKDGSVSFALQDGETVLASHTATVGETVTWRFPLTLLTEKEKAYKVSVSYQNAAGETLDSTEKDVYVYDRPERLGRDGILLDAEGNPFHPVMGYHTKPEFYKKAAEMGINVQQCIYQSKDAASVKSALDAAEEAGVYLLVPLYSNMKPAGHPDNVQMNINLINTIKDHPALLGYMIMDEPFLSRNLSNAGSPEKMYEWLQESYKLIRKIDKKNIVYVVECEKEYFSTASHAGDVLAIDPYIERDIETRGAKVAEHTVAAAAAVNGRKPLWTIVQAWRWLGVGVDDYVPSASDIRSFLYQGLFGGAQGLGYYRVNSLGSDSEDEKQIWEYPLYDGIICFNEKEWEDAQKAFITGEYPTFAQNTDADSPVWYKLFVQNNDIYAVLLNRENKENTVNIPLTSIDGSVTIGSFTASADDISGASAISGMGTLTATLQGAEVVRYKIAVNEDLSGLTTSKFRDIYNYGWAKKAIDTLCQKDIANAKGIAHFAPGEQITRGDFAMFLIKTLGLTAEGGDNFADVSPNAEYADAIRIGRALGILKGTDGVNYLPETPISRQDLMVICARGMRLKKELEAGDASKFADAASIADYAVLDIAAMVRANIVKGYEDDTIRPSGNTTRAEAAVIMERIMTWDNGL